MGDNSRNPLYIETVSKKGYRLIAKVTLDNTIQSGLKKIDESSANSENHRINRPRVRSKSAKVITTGIAVTVTMILAFVVWLNSTPENIEKEKLIDRTSNSNDAQTPSIVVLPFKNLSDDSKQEFFSDGITNDIITDLSQVGSLRVIARQSAYHYKNTQLGLEQISNELGVLYLVVGSVQKSEQRIRIDICLNRIVI